MHGSLLLAFAIYLCWSRQKEGTLGATFAPVRYIFLLMGVFSTFCGLIYNDFSSLGTNIMGESCYTAKPENSTATLMYAKKADKECMYPVGIDPVWYRSTQEIMYMNSLKMKMSVIFGVAQMTLGTCIKGLNALYFRRYVEFIFDVIAQVLLLWALFGFMDILIIVKWTTDWATKEAAATDGAIAPGIISTMIVMFIQGGVKEVDPSKRPEFDLIDNQTHVMKTLLVCALISIPSMLFVNPIYQSKVNARLNQLQEED